MSNSTKFYLIACVTLASVMWGGVRSLLLEEGVPELNPNEIIPTWLRIGVMLLFLVPILGAGGSTDRLVWLLGASVAAGFLPGVPLMPYVRECAHLVLIVTALVIVVRKYPFIFSGMRRSLPLQLYFGYLGLCALSVAVNHFLGGTLWQLKVGIAELILYGAFGVVIAALAAPVSSARDTLADLIDGFAWAALGQAIVALAAIVLLVKIPLMPGNDTVFGLGYWDRMKSTFAGPDQAGVFFAATIPLLIWWANNQGGRIARFSALTYLQLAPWFLIATGSRTGRIAALVVVGACLVRRISRPVALTILPSCALAFYVGFYYQSFPTALEAFIDELTGVSPSLNAMGLSLKGHFFEDIERWRLFSQSLEMFVTAPPLHQGLGFGLGVGGYRTGGFPSAHMSPIDVLVETGIIGAGLLGAFVLIVIARLVKVIRSSPAYEAERAFAALLAVITATLAGATYAVQTWGFVMVIFVMAVIASAGPRNLAGSETSLRQEI